MNKKYFHVLVSTQGYQPGINYPLTKKNIPTALVLKENKVAELTEAPFLFAKAEVKVASYKEDPVQEFKGTKKAKKDDEESTLP